MMVCKILCRLAIAVDDRENPGGTACITMGQGCNFLKSLGFRVQAQQS
jgi:hypothetical protein